MYFTCVFVYSLKNSPLHVRKWRHIIIITKIKCAQSLKNESLANTNTPNREPLAQSPRHSPGDTGPHGRQRPILDTGFVRVESTSQDRRRIPHSCPDLQARMCRKGKLAEDNCRGGKMTTKWTVFP